VLFTVRRSHDGGASPGGAESPAPAGPADNSIKVVVRIRPFADAEAGERSALQQRGGQALAVLPGGGGGAEKEAAPQAFAFDYVAGERTSQDAFFRAVGRPIVDNCLAGAARLCSWPDLTSASGLSWQRCAAPCRALPRRPPPLRLTGVECSSRPADALRAARQATTRACSRTGRAAPARRTRC